MSDNEHRTDVVVVGARCAGAATAMLLARLGHRVTLVDRAAFPSDTLSTHAIARGGVVQLARWGLLDEVLSSGAPAIRHARFHVAGTVTERRIKDKAGVDHLIAPRRNALDLILVKAAVRAGAELHTGVTVDGVSRRGGRVTGVVGRGADGGRVVLPARTVVGADGLHSRIARAVAAPLDDERPAGGTCHYTYLRGPDWGDTFAFHIGERVMAGVFPTHDDEANVWVCGPAETGPLGRTGRYGQFLDRVAGADPDLAATLATAERTAPVRGAVGLPNQMRRPWGPGWALVGDAGLHRDPVSGHGITDAFRDAELVARALHDVLVGARSEAEAGEAYTTLRRDLVAEIFDATSRMSRFPAVDEFVGQHLRASAAIEVEARFLADLPALPAPERPVIGRGMMAA